MTAKPNSFHLYRNDIITLWTNRRYASVIHASFSVTDLGVVLDRHLKMSHHVSKMVQTCTYTLRLINGIMNKLTVTVTERVINAMVTGNLDYCHSLYYYYQFIVRFPIGLEFLFINFLLSTHTSMLVWRCPSIL